MKLTAKVLGAAMILFLVLSWPLIGAARADEAPARPNIVVFLADDLGWSDCSPLGGKEVHTPNMARLAADGMTFTRAFVVSPSCAPSRAALLTGLTPMHNGAMLNHARPRANIKKWPAYFKELGYETAAIGKTAHYNQVREYGFDHVGHFKYHEDDCIEAAVSWLSARKSARPLCLLVGTNWSHVPWPKGSSYSPKELTLPPTCVDTPATRQARARYAAAVANADRDLGLVYEAARQHLGPDTLFLFTSDHGEQFPFAKWDLYDAGIRVPLIAVWPGHVAPGSRSNAMVNWLDLLPTCVEAAGGAPPKNIDGQSILAVLKSEKTTHRDRTFATHSGDGAFNQYPIRAVRDERWKLIRNLDPSREHHSHIDKGKNDSDGTIYWRSWVSAAKTGPAAAAIVERYLHRPAEELYDLKADPWELHNLADDPAHAKIHNRLRAELDAWMTAQGDEGLATEKALPDPQARQKAEARARANANAAGRPSTDRPNILVVLSDDMGFSDIGCYGSEIATPNLDALAMDGLRFTQFYNNARCCPARASLLTGLYPHQAGIGHMMQDRGADGYRGDLNARCRTIAQVLGPAGYRCYAVGKWHVTRFIDPEGPKHNWPLHRGFDRFYGTIHGGGSYYDPSSLVRDDTMISPHADPEYRPKTYYYTDAISEHAARFIGDHARGHTGQPFFMYVAYTAAHWPMHATPEMIAKYKGKYDVGYEPVRQARFEKAARLGLIDPKQPMAPPVGDWGAVRDRKWEAAGMEVYAAMIDRMDQGIGKIVGELKRTGQWENTLVLFVQDNGACAEAMGRTPKPKQNHRNVPRPQKPTLPPMKPGDFAARGSVPAQTRDGYPVRMGNRVFPGPDDTYVAYGENWAHVSNTPFRRYKHHVHEGGISTPLIAHWPSGIAERGGLRSEPCHLIDIMATCIELAGAAYPADATLLPGWSLVGVFAGKPLHRPALFWEHEGNRAVRAGKWKIVAPSGKPWELYDLESDRTEWHDLAAKFPDKVAELSSWWDAWARDSNVLPYPPDRKPGGP